MRNRATARYRGRAVAAGGPSDALREWIGAATYADYDARKLDRMFQESTGQTAVAASADKIGLWLDGAQWGGKTLAGLIAAQPELIANGGFDADTDWNKGSGWSIAAGKATRIPDASASRLYQSGSFTAGGIYRLGVTVRDYIASIVTPRLSGGTIVSGPALSANGNYAHLLQAAVGNTDAGFQGTTATSLSLDNASLKHIPGSHGLNTTASQRLNLLISSGRTTAVGDGSDDNLLTTWLAASGGNTILFDVDVPANTIIGPVVFGGNFGSSFLYVAVTAQGNIGGGVATQGYSVIKGTADYRGKRLVGAMTHDGTTVRLFTLDGGLEYQAAQVGSVAAGNVARIAAFNNSGTAGNFFSGGIARIVPIKKGGLTLADWLKIGPQFAAGTSLA